jgi:hypothetical protein
MSIFAWEFWWLFRTRSYHMRWHACCFYCLGFIIDFVSGDLDWDINIGLTVLLGSIWTKEWLRYTGYIFVYKMEVHLRIAKMLLGMYMLPESSVWLTFNHRREAIASLRYVTPHPTTTEMLAVEDFVINSALYSQSNNRMTDDYQIFFIAGVGFIFIQQVIGRPSV